MFLFFHLVGGKNFYFGQVNGQGDGNVVVFLLENIGIFGSQGGSLDALAGRFLAYLIFLWEGNALAVKPDRERPIFSVFQGGFWCGLCFFPFGFWGELLGEFLDVFLGKLGVVYFPLVFKYIANNFLVEDPEADIGNFCWFRSREDFLGGEVFVEGDVVSLVIGGEVEGDRVAGERAFGVAVVRFVVNRGFLFSESHPIFVREFV